MASRAVQTFAEKVKENGHTPQKTLRVTQLSTVAPERVEWLWKPYIPLGRPVALEGDPGVGKSTLVAKIIAHLTTGTAFPNVLDGTPPPQDFAPRTVCLLTSEDDPADTLVPRIVANNGDVSRVYVIQGWHQTDDLQGIVTMQELELLKTALETYTPAMLVFDPIQSFFGKGDMNHANETRPVLDAVGALCKQYGCTPLYVRHIGKARRDKALHAGLGSIDISANMRSVLFLGEDPDNPKRRIIGHSKVNNAPLGQSMAYLVENITHNVLAPDGTSIEVEAPKLKWDGRSPLTANDLSAPPIVDDEDKSALEQAREFLTELLEDGPVLYDDVKDAGKKSGHAWRTIRRAKPLVGVKARRRELADKTLLECPYEWYLPDGTPPGGPPPDIPGMDNQDHQEKLKKNQQDTESPLVAHMDNQGPPTEVKGNQRDSIGCPGGPSTTYQGSGLPTQSKIACCPHHGMEVHWQLEDGQTVCSVCYSAARPTP